MRHDKFGPSRTLSEADAVEIWKLLDEGWLQSRIAAKFDVNGGRISEVKTGKSFPNSRSISRKFG